MSVLTAQDVITSLASETDAALGRLPEPARAFVLRWRQGIEGFGRYHTGNTAGALAAFVRDLSGLLGGPPAG